MDFGVLKRQIDMDIREFASIYKSSIDEFTKRRLQKIEDEEQTKAKEYYKNNVADFIENVRSIAPYIGKENWKYFKAFFEEYLTKFSPKEKKHTSYLKPYDEEEKIVNYSELKEKFYEELEKRIKENEIDSDAILGAYFDIGRFDLDPVMEATLIRETPSKHFKALALIKSLSDEARDALGGVVDAGALLSMVKRLDELDESILSLVAETIDKEHELFPQVKEILEKKGKWEEFEAIWDGGW